MVAGCGFHPTNAAIDDGSHEDTSDVAPTTPDAQVCFGPSGWSACFNAIPTNAVMLGAAIDTDVGSLDCSATPASWSGSGQPDACFVVGGSITLPSSVGISRVTGSRPLVLVGADSISISSTLDVASQRGENIGPGANVACGAFGQTPTSASNNKGGGGGAGGSFITAGGDGGLGDNGAGMQGTAATAIPAPTKLRAGCPGQQGGDGDGQTGNHGIGGDGGGAVYLLASNTITIASGAIINASGAGSIAGSSYGGGGGGGAGGMIVLYATTITSMGIVFANGGGGSSGGNQAGGGNVGSNPSTTQTSAASGGPSTGNGGAGGSGFAQGTNQTNGVDASSMDTGGGGGGGGAGYILTHGVLGGAVSPTPVTTL